MNEHRARAQAHLVPHFTKGAAWQSDDLIVMDHGDGCYIHDTDGNRYLDGLSGLFCTNLGHGRSDLVAAAAAQMQKLAYYPSWGYANEPASTVSAMIAELAPGDLSEVFLVSSGSEAVESALKFARNYHVSRGDTGRYKVISREWAYHGTTLGALAVTGIPKLRDPFTPMLWDGVRHVRNTLGDAVSPGKTPGELASVRAVEDMILAEGPDSVAMVIAEPVQNGRGSLVPPDGYWPELRRVCDKYGVLLCADEVINAFGRIGHFFASERYGVVPDLITFAKGATSAYQPLGGLVIRRPLVEQIWDSEMASYLHGSTFGGHPVAAAVSVATITAMKKEDIPGRVRDNEGYFLAGLRKLVDGHRTVREVRGAGYFYTLELMADSDTGAELSAEDSSELLGGVLLGFVREAKLLIRPDDRGATMLNLSPPLVADRGVLDDLFDRADQVLDRVDGWVAGRR